MRGYSRCLAMLLVPTLFLGAARFTLAADHYAVDTAHAGIVFKIAHVGISWTFGRFNDFSGSFTLDSADPAKSQFTINIKATSIDTGNKQRDDHLRSPDFFNVKQYPAITFKSTAVRPRQDGYEVTGDLTMHGVTAPITFTLTGGKQAEFPPGVKRTGFTADFTIKRSDFGINKFLEGVGDEVFISVSFEGTRK
jgi:polyisoprenoid-binding protein YceI